MTNGMKGLRTCAPPGLPDDLSLYLGKKTVVKLVLDAVQMCNGESVDYTWFARDGKTFQRPMMLTLLTYCYATGAYGSSDIELSVRLDQMIRYLCAKTYPNINVIRGFRRINRTLIKQCLTLVLKRSWELRFSEEQSAEGQDTSYAGFSLSRWPDRKLSPDFTREADERLGKAVRADGMTLDE